MMFNFKRGNTETPGRGEFLIGGICVRFLFSVSANFSKYFN